MYNSARSIFTPGAFLITGFLGLALLLPGEAALAQIELGPDEVLTDVAADDVDDNCADGSCLVSADLPNSTLMASITAGASEANDVEAVLSVAFDVSAESGDPADETKLIGSTISLSVSADGVLTASGTQSSAGYRLDLQVVDVSEGGMLVATQKIGESSLIDGTEDVLVLEPVVLPVSLTRGHSYRVELKLFIEAVGDAMGSASADFASTISWDDLVIAAGSDVFGAVADLDERVDALEADVADLREHFENHTHEYLTGRGTGHNNTVATTTQPDFPDGGGVSPVPDSDDQASPPAPPPVFDDGARSEHAAPRKSRRGGR